jgi:hypothetical protein
VLGAWVNDAMKKLTVDSICAAYADKGVKVVVKPLPNAPKVILFEGDELAFEFLGKLFLAHAKAINGCGFQIGPKHAGNKSFSTKAALGIYLHRLPCDNDAPRGYQPSYKKKKSGTQN